jgi:hypothetical protein
MCAQPPPMRWRNQRPPRRGAAHRRAQGCGMDCAHNRRLCAGRNQRPTRRGAAHRRTQGSVFMVCARSRRLCAGRNQRPTRRGAAHRRAQVMKVAKMCASLPLAARNLGPHCAGTAHRRTEIRTEIAVCADCRPNALALGAPAMEPLIAALKDKDSKDSDVRQAAAEALGEIKDPRAVEPLIAALKDAKWRVRYAAAYALGEIGDPAPWSRSSPRSRMRIYVRAGRRRSAGKNQRPPRRGTTHRRAQGSE